MPNLDRLSTLIACFVCALLVTRCTLEEDFLTEPGTRINLAIDTLTFDTVFTEVGSATRFFKIYNPHSRPLLLSSVRVESSNGGRFRINVDGLSGTELTNVFVAPEDSIYVFAEVTVDPDAPLSESPFILEGRVVVRATTEEQSVLLVAYGQNANYLPQNRERGGFGLLTCDFGEVAFDDPKPYVLYGSLIVDSCTMVLPEGARLYVHGGLVATSDPRGPPAFNDGRIFFIGSGKLRVEGTAERPVLIAADRLEERFVRRAGQYSGIYLLSGSGPHAITHADIRNSDFGVYVDSATTLVAEQTKIRYTAREGIYGRQAIVRATNVLIHDTGGSAFFGTQGGSYALDYCTLVNFGGRSTAATFANGAEYENADGRFTIVAPIDVRVRNSMIYGSARDALGLVDFEAQPGFAYDFRNTILRIDQLTERWPTFRNDCVECLYPDSDEALFVNIRQDSFQLDTLSVAEMKALPLPGIDLDLIGNARDAQTPDIGAYEYQYE